MSSSDTTRVGPFMRLNPLNFVGSKVEEDPQEFDDDMEKIFKVIHASDTNGRIL